MPKIHINTYIGLCSAPVYVQSLFLRIPNQNRTSKGVLCFSDK